jgi:Carboxypeptidase regulatory-like domain
VTATDTAGTFRFDPLPAGDYKVTVEKPGFVTLEAAASSGSTMTLEHAGAIEGTLVDGAGDPLINVSVYALQLQDGGEPRPVAMARTDDLGRYRVHSLSAGDYYVKAAPYDAQQAFYPAASVIEDAKLVRVSLGRDTGSIDFTLNPTPAPAKDSAVVLRGGPPGTARIVGQVVDAASSKPIRNASIRIVPVDGQRFGLLVRTDAQGRFAFSSLPAGRYSASAERATGPSCSGMSRPALTQCKASLRHHPAQTHRCPRRHSAGCRSRSGTRTSRT